ncbi:MAG: transporter, ATPase subunit, partial [Phycisphaerales bacterium]|nr:transporter, ATPase subunit [Phycisphaerales bacterium]
MGTPTANASSEAGAAATAGPLVTVRRATFGYAGRPVVRADDLRLYAGRCLGVFGPNGAGKTTLVRGLTGLLPPLAGTVTRAARTVVAPVPAEGSGGRDGLRFGYLPQYRGMDPAWPMSGFDAAALAASARGRLG